MRRAGERGEGRWERVTWDEALDDIGGRIRKAILENRRHELMYHVGRPGEDGYANRVLQAWGIDGHNSHTNVCSSSARLGHFLWCGADRPSPDYANAQTILLLSSHLETGHYFNPHAQRIIESQGQRRHADLHRSAAVEYVGQGGHLAAGVLGHRRGAAAGDRADPPRRGALQPRVRPQVGELARLPRAPNDPDLPETFDAFIVALKELYAQFTPEFAEAETGVPNGTDRRGGAGDRPRRHALRDPQLARGGVRQSLGMADHALPLPARRADRIARHGRRREHARHQQVRAEASESAAAAGATGTSCSSRRSSRSRSSR